MNSTIVTIRLLYLFTCIDLSILKTLALCKVVNQCVTILCLLDLRWTAISLHLHMEEPYIPKHWNCIFITAKSHTLCCYIQLVYISSLNMSIPTLITHRVSFGESTESIKISRIQNQYCVLLDQIRKTFDISENLDVQLQVSDDDGITWRDFDMKEQLPSSGTFRVFGSKLAKLFTFIQLWTIVINSSI